jgi:hypothetical protein
VSGEPGIGKTRLAAELAADVERDGGVVLYGHCDDGLASAAQPFAEALSAYVAACPRDELRVQIGAHGGALLPVLPSLTERLPAVHEPAPTTPDAERLRTCSATTSLLEAATAAAPVLLILDDLHWADELSLLLLQHVLRAEGSSRLLLVATYRDSEESRSPLLADVVTGLARRPDVERLALAPLGEAEVAALLVDAGATEALAERVRVTTDGNPFFVGEVVQALGDGHAMDMALTPRVRDVVRWRLGRLPSAVSEVLTSAALVGPEFHVDVVVDVAGGGTDQVLDALEAAERARLIRPAGGLDRFAFAHALVRQAIVEDLAAGRRIRLHARAAEALERVSQTRAVAPAELAMHLDAAGGLADASKTLRYARQAGDEAAARLAFDIAAAHYDVARRAQSRVPGVTVEDRLGLDLAHASALRMGGDARANQTLRKVADDAALAGDASRLATALLLSVLGVATEFLREDHEMVALLRRGLELLPAADSPARAELQAFLALKGLYTIPDAERRAMLDDAVAMARRVGNPDALASALTAHSWSVMDPRLRRERLLLADELVRIGPSAFPHAACDGHILRFLALVEDGDLPGADAALAAARAAARLPVSRWTVTQWEASRALLAGKLATAEELSLRATDAATRCRSRRFRPAAGGDRQRLGRQVGVVALVPSAGPGRPRRLRACDRVQHPGATGLVVRHRGADPPGAGGRAGSAGCIERRVPRGPPPYAARFVLDRDDDRRRRRLCRPGRPHLRDAALRAVGTVRRRDVTADRSRVAVGRPARFDAGAS